MPRPKKSARKPGVKSSQTLPALELPENILRLIRELALLWPPIWMLFQPRLNIVCLKPTTGPDQQPMLSKLRADTVAWKNDDVIARRIKFEGANPLRYFPAAGITLNPGENSMAYPVRQDVPKDRYQYTIIPAYPSSGGPGEPVVFSDD